MKSFGSLILIIFACLVSSVGAEPVVIYDSGQAKSTYPYRQLFGPMTGESQKIQDSWIFGELPKEEASDSARQDIDWSFPLVTKKMTAKRMDKPIDGYFPRMMFPVCVLGDDSLSLEWLRRNRDNLVSINAQCFIVSATNSETVKPLLHLLEGIIAYPANGDVISDYFKVSYYPVLITERHASQ
jgi:integrating conjugative element protein (TIGR03765 family)